MQYVITLKKKSPTYNLWMSNKLKSANCMGVHFTFNPLTKDYVYSGSVVDLSRIAHCRYFTINVVGKPVGEVKPLPIEPAKPVEKESDIKEVEHVVKRGIKEVKDFIEKTVEKL